MNEITRKELEAAMHPNGKIENVVVLVTDDFNQHNYFRMCVFGHTTSIKSDARIVNFLSDMDIWLFLPNAHLKARECGGREVWKCDIVYRSNHWEGDDARIYAVDVFTVHPKERLEKWS